MFQDLSYTIRNLGRNLGSKPDIEQYKLLNIQENPLDNQEYFLDVMCFPVLFPDGQIRKYHPSEIKLSPSKYIKSRMYNKDSCFLKDSQYIFYLHWQKEMRDLCVGLFNTQKSSKTMSMSV